MLIKEVVLHNFRQYKDTNVISFNTNDKQNIVVVSGKNGNGKTNFLVSLVWCLYGKDTSKVDDFFKDYVEKQGGYNKYIANSLNILAKNSGESIFYVSITFKDLQIADLACNEIKITRSFDTNKPQPETLEILLDGQASELFREVNAEHFIRDFLVPLEAAKFFFFDAEKIVSLAEANQIEQRRELSKAYSEVLGIKKYEDLRTSLQQLQGRFSEDSATPKDRQNLIRIRSEVDSLEIEQKERTLRIEKLREIIITNRYEIRLIQERLIKESNIITADEVFSLQTRKDEIDLKLEDAKVKLRDMLELAPFAMNGDQLLLLMDQLEKEAAFRTTKFRDEEIESKTEEIVDEIEKNRHENFNEIVPTKIKDFYNSQIRHLVRKYFFDTPQTEPVHVLHEYTETEKRELSELLSYLKHSYKELFKSIARDYNNLKFESDSIIRKLRSAETNTEDPILEDYRIRKSLFESEVVKSETEIENLIKSNAVDANKSSSLKSEIAELRKKVDIANKYIEKNKVAERLIQELNEFIINYKEQKKKSLEEKILNGLSTLMHTLKVSKVVVDMIQQDIDIQLYNERNEVIAKEGLSKGQQQLYATSLLKALVEESNINFPVFIDSPMQKFDLEHAKNIIKYFYPNVSEQVVIFPLLGKELTEKEFSYLQNNISQCYLIHKKGETSSFIPIEDNKLFETYHKLYPHD